MIIDALVHNAELLPVCRVSSSSASFRVSPASNAGVRLGIHVPGTKDEGGHDLYLDVSDFGDHRKVTFPSSKVDIGLPKKSGFKLPWRKAGPLNHLDDIGDSDQ